ncbi:MAG: thaumatin family protein [Legionellaceae bacterium]|nr:thaumatin family protein [Legionellaceae bacterium]
MFGKRIFLAFIGMVYAFISYASSGDPVSYTLTPSTGFVAGTESQVLYRLTNNLPKYTLMVISYTSVGSIFTVDDACNGQNLAPGASCDIVINFDPKFTGVGFFQLTYGYDHNRILLPPVPVSSNVTPPPSGSVYGVISGLAPVVYQSERPTFTVTFNNNTANTVTGYIGDAASSNLVTISPVSAGTLSIVSNQCGTFGAHGSMVPHGTCQVQVQLTPSGAYTGAFTVASTYTVVTGGSGTATAQKSATISSANPGCTVVHAEVGSNIPSQTFLYSDNVVQFIIQNECTTQSTLLGTVQVTASSGAQAIVALKDQCSNQLLTAGSSCSVYASVTPTALTSNMQINALVPVVGGSHASASTSAAVVASTAAPQHKLRFVNQCPFAVWYGISNGQGTVANPSPPPATITYSPDPTPGAATGASADAYLLQPLLTGVAPVPTDLLVTEYLNGVLWPRTGCAMVAGALQCETGMCNTLTNSGTCVVATDTASIPQPVPPYTKIEMTIVAGAGGDGVYDVSLVNGMNVPTEIKAMGPVDTSSAVYPFNCTGTGAIIQPVYSTSNPNTLGACSWTFNAQGISGIDPATVSWVSPGAQDGCANTAACTTAGEVCGTAFSSIALPAGYSTPINRRCGDFIGYWSLQDFTGYTSSLQWGAGFDLFDLYDMSTPMSTISTHVPGYGNVGGAPAEFWAMLSCKVTDNSSLGSGYQPLTVNPLPANACGCENWNTSTVAPTAVTKQCFPNTQNNDWLATSGTSITAFNAILWLKQACPTAYSYPFDDASTSFSCTEGAGGVPLVTDYQVTFCPGGVTGLPAGATEGR